MRGVVRFRRHEISCRYEKTLCLHDVSCRLHFISPDMKLAKTLQCICSKRHKIFCFLWRFEVIALHCIANLTTVLFTWEFGTVMKSQNGLFDRHEIRPVVSFISPVSCKRYEAYDQRPICDKSHDGRRETSCKRPLSTAYYTDIGYLIYKLLYDANIFFGFIITYPVLSEVNIIRYGTNISDAIYFEILEISCNYPIL